MITRIKRGHVSATIYLCWLCYSVVLFLPSRRRKYESWNRRFSKREEMWVGNKYDLLLAPESDLLYLYIPYPRDFDLVIPWYSEDKWQHWNAEAMKEYYFRQYWSLMWATTPVQGKKIISPFLIKGFMYVVYPSTGWRHCVACFYIVLGWR